MKEQRPLQTLQLLVEGAHVMGELPPSSAFRSRRIDADLSKDELLQASNDWLDEVEQFPPSPAESSETELQHRRILCDGAQS